MDRPDHDPRWKAGDCGAGADSDVTNNNSTDAGHIGDGRPRQCHKIGGGPQVNGCFGRECTEGGEYQGNQ